MDGFQEQFLFLKSKTPHQAAEGGGGGSMLPIEGYYSMSVILYTCLILLYWLQELKKFNENIILSLNVSSKSKTPTNTNKDKLAYFYWFGCCFVLFSYTWLYYDQLVPSPLDQTTPTDTAKNSYVSIYSLYLVGQIVVSLGHITPFSLFQPIGSLISTISFHLIFLTFISPSSISPISLLSLSIATFLLFLTLLLKRYPLSSHPTYTIKISLNQVEDLCYLYGTPAVALVGILLLTQWWHLKEATDPLLWGLVGILFSLCRPFWLKWVNEDYQALLAKIADSVLLVPWLLVAMSCLDELASE